MSPRKRVVDNIHYLKLTASHKNGPPESVEELIRDLSKQLDRLETEINQRLGALELQLGKGEKGSKNPRKLQKEIEKLRENFGRQIEDIAKSFKPAPSEAAKSPESWSGRLKGWMGREKPLSETAYEEVDPFGRDPAFEQKLKPFFDFLFYKYWRVDTYGVENIPSKGRALLVANHSGTLPYDGSMIRMAVTNDHPAQRDVRFLVEDFVYYLPFIGTCMYRIGGVRASPENAERLLNSNHLVAVFPEGVKGIGKYYSQRYHLQRFGRGGFIKLALRTGSPIIPVAVIGAEEIHPMIYKSSLLAKPLGIPYAPVTPTFPFLGPLGLLPLPSKWSIHFGQPIDLKKFGPEILEDELEIHKLSEMVRQKIQQMVTEALKQRRSVWWG